LIRHLKRLVMFCFINYYANKQILREYFFKNFLKARHHQTSGSEIHYWLKLFGGKELVNPVLQDMGLYGLNVLPRFSFQYKNTRLPEHIDIDRIVGININLIDDWMPTIRINGCSYAYECALIDVGSKIHSVEPEPRDRLVLKLAFREPWDKIYGILRQRNLITYGHECDYYQSILLEEDKQFVKI